MKRTAFILPALLALTLVATTASLAAKEPIPPEDPARMAYRQQGVVACVASNPPRALFDTREQVDVPTGCACAVDDFMRNREVAELPRLEPGNVKNELNFAFLYCRAMAAVGDLENAAKATEQMARNAEAAAKAGREDPMVTGPSLPQGAPRLQPGLFERLDLPGWLIFVIPALALGISLFEYQRRRGRSRDLLGPPPSMRPDFEGDAPSPRPNDFIS